MEKGFFEHFLYVLYVFTDFFVRFVRYILDFNLYFISDSSWVAPIWPVTTMGCAIRIVIKPKISRSLEKRVISYQLYTQGILKISTLGGVRETQLQVFTSASRIHFFFIREFVRQEKYNLQLK